MSSYSDILGIDSEDLSNLVLAYSSYAESFDSEPSEQELHVMASSCVIGAAYQALLDPAASRGLFLKAAVLYRKLNMPFWRVCDICSQVHKDASYRFLEIDNENLFFYYLKILDVRIHEFMYSTFDDFRLDVQENLPELAPGIQIPYSIFITALEDSFTWSSSRLESKVDGFIKLISRFGRILDKLKEDEYRWKNLQGNILPYEPLEIAMVIVLLKKWISHYTFEELLNHLQGMSEHYKVILYVCYDIISSSAKD